MFSGQIEFEPTAEAQADLQAGTHLSLTCQMCDRLHLRSLVPKDASELFALVDANRSYLKQWLPWLDDNQSADDSLSFIQHSLAQAQANKEFVSAICHDDQIIGQISLHAINWSNRSSTIGYWLAEPHQGKGIITRACQTILDYGFTPLNLNRIEICCAAENLRSQAVAERLGLTYEGTCRDAEWLYDHFVNHRIYSILQSEWPSNAPSLAPAESSQPPQPSSGPNQPG